MTASLRRQPVSHEKIDSAIRPHSIVRDDGLFHVSTNCAARGEDHVSDAEKKRRTEAQDRRAWAATHSIYSDAAITVARPCNGLFPARAPNFSYLGA